jgi:tetratricopeptide (TPR) repeat protein
MSANDYLARGRGWRQRGDLDNAIHDFTMALRLKPDFEEAKIELESAKKAKAAADCHYQLGCPK